LCIVFFETQLNEIDPKLIQKDPKTLLQELLQSKKSDLPIYTVVSIEGEAHSQTFTIECIIKKSDIKTQGIGNSRRIAEQEAAAKAYQLMLEII
jgi:ribonuclease III